jgi:hypothetical protein
LATSDWLNFGSFSIGQSELYFNQPLLLLAKLEELFGRNKLPFSGTTLTRHSLLDLILFKILKLIYPNIALGEMSDDL